MNPCAIDNVMLSQRGRTLYVIGGFKFRFQKCLADGTERWSCCKDGCKSFIKVNKKQEVVESFMNHSHDRDSEHVLSRQKLSNLVKRKAVDNPQEQPMKLVRKEIMNADAPLTSYDALLIKNNIYYARAAQMQRKWKSLRDCYTRELSKTKKAKSGSAAENRRKYIYFNELSFLQPVCEGKQTRSENEGESTEIRCESNVSTPQTLSQAAPTENKRRKKSDQQTLSQPLDESVPNPTEVQNEVGDADMHFLLSLLPHFKSIPEHLKFEAQFDIMRVIKKYKPAAHAQSSYHPQQCETLQYSYIGPTQQNNPSSSHTESSDQLQTSTSYVSPSPTSLKDEPVYSPAESFTSETVDYEDVKF